MNKNRLLIAVIALALLGGLAVVSMRSRESNNALEKPSATLPIIKSDEITKISVENPEKQVKVVLTKAEGGWTVTEPVAAKADSAAVDSMLDKLGSLEVSSIAATHKENYEKVGIDAPHAIHVKVYAGEKSLLDAYVGASKSTGTMLRKEGEEQVIAVRGAMRYAFDKDLKNFRDRTITDLDPATLTSMTLASDKGSFKFEKLENGWAQAKGEKPIKDFAPTKVDGVASAFAKLRASDFANPAETPASLGLDKPVASVTLTPKEGEPVLLSLGKVSEDNADYYLSSDKSAVLFRVPKYSGDRLLGDASAFSEPPKKPGEAPPGGAPARMPMAGGGDLPPEILQQLQQQMGGAASPH